MARRVALKWDEAALKRIISHKKVYDVLEELCDDVVAAAGEGYAQKVDTAKRSDRPIGIVFTDTFAARHHNARTNALLKALESAKRVG